MAQHSRKQGSNVYRSGGTRGGRDQFKWDDVKTDKDRENYLGNSVNAAVGRWQKGKDIFWYAKSKEGHSSSLDEEKQRLKAMDEDLINSALGLAPKRKVTSTHELEHDELRQLLSRGTAERSSLDVERVEGLGTGGALAKHAMSVKPTSSTEREIQALKAQQARKARGDDISAESLGSDQLSEARAGDDRNGGSSDDSRHDGQRHQKHRREHKHRKHHKEHKEHRRRKSHRSESDEAREHRSRDRRHRSRSRERRRRSQSR